MKQLFLAIALLAVGIREVYAEGCTGPSPEFFLGGNGFGCELGYYRQYDGADDRKIVATRAGVTFELATSVTRTDATIQIQMFETGCGDRAEEIVSMSQRSEMFILYRASTADAQPGDELRFVDVAVDFSAEPSPPFVVPGDTSSCGDVLAVPAHSCYGSAGCPPDSNTDSVGCGAGRSSSLWVAFVLVAIGRLLRTTRFVSTR